MFGIYAATNWRNLYQLLRYAGAALPSAAGQLKLAVAFVSAEWMRLLTDCPGTGRLVCWLDSGATDPEGIVELMRPERRFQVRHLHAMHAKVYLSPGDRGFAVVGSANLSAPALAGGDHSGQDEAAVLVESPSEVAAIDHWFEDLWARAQPAWNTRTFPSICDCIRYKP